VESVIGSNLFLDEETHGFKVKRHINWDSQNWVAITPVGTIVIYRDRTDWMLYAVYSNHKGTYHVHVPYENMTALDDRVEEVRKEVLKCIRYAECYIDSTKDREMVYSMNPLLLRDFIPFGVGPFYTKYI
jgi:hypothetical protein